MSYTECHGLPTQITRPNSMTVAKEDYAGLSLNLVDQVHGDIVTKGNRWVVCESVMAWHGNTVYLALCEGNQQYLWIPTQLASNTVLP